MCFGTNVRTDRAKIAKISIFQVIWLGFSRSLGSAIRYETNKTNQWSDEGPVGSRTVEILRDLWRRKALAGSREAFGGREACPGAKMNNWSIWYQGMSRTTGSCQDVQSLTRKHELRDWDWPSKNQRAAEKVSIFKEILLGISRSLGSAISYEANMKMARRLECAIAACRAVLCCAKIKHQAFVSECCQQKAIFSVTSYRNIDNDILSFSSKGTAAAKMKTARWLCK